MNTYILPIEPGLAHAHLIDLMAAAQTAHAAVQFDIRYAGTNNFTGTAIYDAPRAFIMADAAAALLRAAQHLSGLGYGLRVFDAYRPWHVTVYFWTHFPADHLYLANPNHGSRHNRGCAVDLTLYDLATGAEVRMPSAYDEFNEKAHLHYAGGNASEREARELLQQAMLSEGFSSHPHEWWHFDYQNWQRYAVRDDSFAMLDLLLLSE